MGFSGFLRWIGAIGEEVHHGEHGGHGGKREDNFLFEDEIFFLFCAVWVRWGEKNY